jgi:aryl-alcohol dehydrogenase-like predicted oxidoreductase
MVRSEGLALAPWGLLGGGKIRSNAEGATSWRRSRRYSIAEVSRQVYHDFSLSRAAESFTIQIDTNYTLLAVAIAYHLQKSPYVFPIIRGRKFEQLQGNLPALGH